MYKITFLINEIRWDKSTKMFKKKFSLFKVYNHLWMSVQYKYFSGFRELNKTEIGPFIYDYYKVSTLFLLLQICRIQYQKVWYLHVTKIIKILLLDSFYVYSNSVVFMQKLFNYILYQSKYRNDVNLNAHNLLTF